MKATPLVSIVMCTYNGEKYLGEQLDSILSQTYKNIELIIVDDVSIDSTVSIIKNWSKKDERIVLYQNDQNLGYNKNFEKAITFANGEFISLSDQDDIWFPDKIERLLKKFDSEDVVLTHARSVNFINGEVQYPKGKLLPPFTGGDPKKLFYDNQISGHKIMFRRLLLDKISPIPPNMFYDWWIGVLATCVGSINADDGYLVKYRIHDANNHINVARKIRNKHIDHVTAWRYFLQIKEMNENDKAFLRELIAVFEQHRQSYKLFDTKLFSFLFKNRKVIFANRRKLANDFFNLKFISYYMITNFR